MQKPPTLNPAQPFEERALIAVLYRLMCDAWDRGDHTGFVRAKKALALALKENP